MFNFVFMYLFTRI